MAEAEPAPVGFGVNNIDLAIAPRAIEEEEKTVFTKEEIKEGLATGAMVLRRPKKQREALMRG